MQEDELYARLVEGVRKPTKHKIALVSCGASGAGKTTTRNIFVKDAGLTTTFVYLNIDMYWKHAPTHSEARALFGRIISRVIEDGYSLLFDATCRYTPEMERTIAVLKQKGYTVKVAITYAKLDTVLKRLRKRVQQYVRPELGAAIHEEVSQKIESLMKNPDIDELFLYDNETTTRLIYHKSAKKISCLFPDTAFYFDVSKYC